MAFFGLFWLFLHVITFLSAILSRIYTLFGVLCTGLNNVVVYQNWQIWGMIQILKSTFVRNICNLSSEVYRDIEVSFFFKISIPLRSCLVFSYLKWRIISPFARSGDGIFTSIYHANSAAKVSMTPKIARIQSKTTLHLFQTKQKNICRILFIIIILQ